MKPPEVIKLTEHETVCLPENALPYDAGNLLYQHYSAQINVECFY